MRKILLFLIIISFISCSEKSELSNTFNCESTNNALKKTITDFNKNFEIDIPTHWKTELYYSQSSSEIYSADTTKQLTETYILDVSQNLGELNLDDAFFKKNDSILAKKNLLKINSKNITFREKEAYYYITQEIKQNFIVNRLNLLIKTSTNQYISAYCEVYGKDQIEERLCDGISVLNTIKFLD